MQGREAAWMSVLRGSALCAMRVPEQWGLWGWGGSPGAGQDQGRSCGSCRVTDERRFCFPFFLPSPRAGRLPRAPHTGPADRSNLTHSC